MALGIGTPIKCNTVGAMAPRIPFWIVLFLGSTNIRGTGLVVCAVFGDPSGLIMVSQFPWSAIIMLT